MRRKCALLCATVFTLLAASACAGGGGAVGAYDVKEHVSLPIVRLSSFQTLEESGDCTVKMRVFLLQRQIGGDLR